MYLIVLCVVILTASLCFLFTHIFLSIWWIDEPLHFAGGAWVALTVFTICYNGMYKKIAGSRRIYLLIAGALLGLLAGSVYEVFEIHAGLTHWPKDLGEDIHDLLFDTLGGLVGGMIFYSSFIKTWAAQQNKRPLIIVASVAALALITALCLKIPYDQYYLRWAICAAAIYLMAVINFERGLKWVGIMFILALVFEPLEKIHIPPAAWLYLDIITAGIFACFTYRTLSQK
jgi:hypothetical protein